MFREPGLVEFWVVEREVEGAGSNVRFLQWGVDWVVKDVRGVGVGDGFGGFATLVGPDFLGSGEIVAGFGAAAVDLVSRDWILRRKASLRVCSVVFSEGGVGVGKVGVGYFLVGIEGSGAVAASASADRRVSSSSLSSKLMYF